MLDRNAIDELKKNNPIVDTARRLGLELFKSGRDYRSYSIYNKGNNPTATVFLTDKDYFWDFKADAGGDVIELVAVVKYNGDRLAALNELSGGTLKFNNGDNNRLKANINKWHEALRDEDINYLTSRGLTREYIDKMLLGYDAAAERIIIPYFSRGQVVYYCGRAIGEVTKDNPKYKKAVIDGVNNNIPWGLHTLDRVDKPLIIAEGAFDAMSFDIAGYRVLATMGSTSHKDREIFRGYAAAEQKQGRDIYIGFDNDDAGTKFFKGMAMELISHKLSNFKRLDLPAKFKDISECFAAGGNLQALIDGATDGVISFADSFTPEQNETQAQNEKRYNEFKSFMLKSARYIDKAELSRIVNRLMGRGDFEPQWLDEVRKMATAAPLEDDIIEAILKEHDLIFDERLGFYEFSGINWIKVSDTHISHYISDELGRFYTTGKRISTIKTNLKAKVEQTCEFDKNQILVFKNGVLEIETGKFRSHDKKDMNTIVLPYNYDPAAQCQNWKRFLENVTWRAARKLQDAEGDARITVLQEFCGYALFTNCAFDKALLLLGEGGNGKSVFLNTIKSAFGKENYSTVEVDKLNQNFKAVQLIGKLINFTSEQSLNFSGAETVFKTAVSGETLSDSFKGRDNFNFNPRAKFIISANELPASRDKSFGFIRRFLFVKFQNTFIDPAEKGREPIAENNERAIDVTLRADDAFNDELSGIFNWIYEGYKRLKEQKHFTNSPDQKELEEAFAAGNNPLIDFVIDEKLAKDDTFKEWKELYASYREWNTQNGYTSMGKRNFKLNLIRALKNQKVDFQETQKHDGRRGIKFNYDFPLDEE